MRWQQAFILPVVMMLAVAISIMAVTTTRSLLGSSDGLTHGYEDALADEAAKVGAEIARSCLNQGFTWSSPLKPNTNCNGQSIGSNKDALKASMGGYPVGQRYVVSLASGSPPTVTVTGESVIYGPNDHELKKASRTVKVRMDQPATTVPVKTVTAITAGGYHVCALAYAPSLNQSAYCWGLSNCGQLGNGNNLCNGSLVARSIFPVAVKNGPADILNGKTVTAISAGRNHTCAIANSKAYCWGIKVGQASNGNDPYAVGGTLADKTVISISAGKDHDCAVAYTSAPTDAQGYCWGNNTYGQLGLGDYTSYSEPQVITGGALAGKKLLTISAGNGYTCATAYTTAASDAQAYCWGSNGAGQLGINSSSYSSTFPNPVAVGGLLAGKTVNQVSTSMQTNASDEPWGHTCAIAQTVGSPTSARAYCWGDGTTGKVGNGASGASNIRIVPVQATGAMGTRTVTAISAGKTHTCAVAYASTPSNALAYCWGSRYCGALGDANGICDAASMASIANAPIAVRTSSPSALAGKIVTAISANPDFSSTCAVAYSGSVANSRASCWGSVGWGLGGMPYETTGGDGGTTTLFNVPQPVDTTQRSALGQQIIAGNVIVF